MIRYLVTLLALTLFSALFAAEEPITLKTSTGNVCGRLMTPDSEGPYPVVLIIAGSGPTDMNGNSIGSEFHCNSLKMLAEGLAAKGIASVRYDKRGIGESIMAGIKEENLRFEHYIEDAIAWTEMLKNDARFNRVAIAGHSEGSLIGMVASTRSSAVNAYISIAGAGRPAYELLEEQLQRQPEQVLREANSINNELREGRMVDDIPPHLASLYRKSVQPYLISWFRYNPAEEIKKVKCPVLIVQGDKDIQVPVKDAEKLYAARIFSSYRVIKDMNHVLKHCESLEMIIQLETYKSPEMPIKAMLTEIVTAFIKQ